MCNLDLEKAFFRIPRRVLELWKIGIPVLVSSIFNLFVDSDGL